ncbi:DinB family protein [Alkalicoccobacillus plakortidis]|uniref:DinB family protein n=2 Tax=Alkalicoccobacillus plakortidis TaxID=444060 RepID=A0ABT0XP29_9BACI|nr:DinB family protein [Alkalicoccobacillus plakortidis]
MKLFVSQYEWVRKTRDVLFQYCESLPQEDYVKEVESFGGDSIRNLHVHVAECYQVWLGKRALKKELSLVNPIDITTVQQMRELFKQTDDIVNEFLHTYEGQWEQKVGVTYRNGESNEFTALWLFTHTLTHEFHHKGQIVKIGRQLGYIPPDTDLIEE